MQFSRTAKAFLSVALGLGLSLEAGAHRAWLLPSSTVLSGDSPWVTFDGAVSNTLFFPDYVPLRLDGLQVVQPDGSSGEPQNTHTGKYRTTFDLNLAQPGTYRVAVASHGLQASWEDAQGERHRWPGRGQRADEKDFASAVPKNAHNLQVSRNSRRLETFVTAGAPSDKALAPSGRGLELVPITHPNDLYAGEPASFRLLIDGEPAAGAEVEIIPGAMRYRDSQREINLEADAEGRIQVQWPAAGRYWLSASYRDDKAAPPATARVGSYSATLEVLPE